MNIDPVLAQFIITAIVAIPVYFKMRSEWRKATADADSSNVKDALELKREYKSDMTALETKYDLLANKFDIAQIELKEARILIEQLTERDEKREAEMRYLEEQFKRDALLRANVEEALKLSNQKIVELTQRVSALEDELDQARNLLIEKDRIIAELQSRPGGRLIK